MYRKVVTATFAVLSLAALAAAQTKPNFSGTWKLNVAKSDFAVMPAPESQTSTIEHNEPAVKVTVKQVNQQGAQEYTIAGTTDGKEGTTKVGPNDVKYTLGWDGPALVLNSKLDFQGQEVLLKSVMTLSDDGKMMTQNVHIASAMGELDQKLIFDKDSGGDTMTKATEMPKATMPVTTAGAKPNFSGTWKLNVAKSDNGPIPGPESRTDVIEHNDPSFKIMRKEVAQQGPREYPLLASTDGKEVVNQLGPIEAKITGSWDGPALVADMKLKINDQDIVMHQVSTLSPDGKVMTTKIHYTTAMGELDTVEVYEKQ